MHPGVGGQGKEWFSTCIIDERQKELVLRKEVKILITYRIYFLRTHDRIRRGMMTCVAFSPSNVIITF